MPLGIQEEEGVVMFPGAGIPCLGEVRDYSPLNTGFGIAGFVGVCRAILFELIEAQR
jgi:hypothetical protein